MTDNIRTGQDRADKTIILFTLHSKSMLHGVCKICIMHIISPLYNARPLQRRVTLPSVEITMHQGDDLYCFVYHDSYRNSLFSNFKMWEHDV